MARGSVHPSEVLRAVMMELESIGLEVRGAEVDKKIAQTQASLSAVESAAFTAGSWMPEGLLHGSPGHSDTKTFTKGVSGLAVLDSKEGSGVDDLAAVDHTVAMIVDSNEEQESEPRSLIVAAAATGLTGADFVSDAHPSNNTYSTAPMDAGALTASPILPPLSPLPPLPPTSSSSSSSFIDQQSPAPFLPPGIVPDMHSPASTIATAPSSSDCKNTSPNKSLAHTIAEHSEDLETKHSVSRSASAVSVILNIDALTDSTHPHTRWSTLRTLQLSCFRNYSHDTKRAILRQILVCKVIGTVSRIFRTMNTNPVTLCLCFESFMLFM